MKRALTLPDLVVLSMLFEQPMHGYQVVQELERRDVADWAGVSRPQVYYSLDKLKAQRLIVPSESGESLGPERQAYKPAAAARDAFEAALQREEWATQRTPPPFLTWVALSVQGSRAAAKNQFGRRREFLKAQIARERVTLAAINADRGPMVKVAVKIVALAIAQFELELAALPGIERALRHR
jgi:DNA-binding PadR family transcriptional regulator